MPTLQKIAAQNYTPEQVREIIRAAWEIADERGSNTDEWLATFAQACQLLGQQSATFVAEQPMSLPAFPNGGRR